MQSAVEVMEYVRNGNFLQIPLSKDLLTQEDITEIFRATGALWQHSGDPAEPHPRLTSGLHSNAFLNTLVALSYPPVCLLFADQLTRKLNAEFDVWGEDAVDWVVGSDHASAVFSFALAERLYARHDFTEKRDDGQVWKRFAIKPGAVILQAEELMTTGKTQRQVREALRQAHDYPLTFAKFVAILVHRSKVMDVEGTPVVSLVHYDFPTWPEDECPLCQMGSTLDFKPKHGLVKK